MHRNPRNVLSRNVTSAVFSLLWQMKHGLSLRDLREEVAWLTRNGLPRRRDPVTIGNIIGGGLLVGVVYWFIYLRRSSKVDR